MGGVSFEIYDKLKAENERLRSTLREHGIEDLPTLQKDKADQPIREGYDPEQETR